MSIYKSHRINYRRIWTEHYGSIPTDIHGKKFHIHHIDGNKKNNDISNLIAVSEQQHYDIHYSQGDWYACLRIASRMNLSAEEKSELARKTGKEVQTRLLFEGKHNFQTMTSERRSEISRGSGAKSRDMKVGIHAINADPILAKDNARNAGLISKAKKAGFHDPNKTGGVFVRGTCWWTNKETGERLRQKDCPGEGWNRGMKR
jgi:hypothetical protein